MTERMTTCRHLTCGALVIVGSCWCWEHGERCHGEEVHSCRHPAHDCHEPVHYCERHRGES